MENVRIRVDSVLWPSLLLSLVSWQSQVQVILYHNSAVAIIKCFKKRRSPLEDGEYEALEAEKNQ